MSRIRTLDVTGKATTEGRFLQAFLTFCLLSSAGAADVPFTNRVIQAGIDGPSSVFVADINGDSHSDVLASAMTANEIAWWENVGGFGTNWVAHVLDLAFNSTWSVYAADLDTNGTLDILGTSSFLDDVAWWRNTDGTGTNCTKHIIDGSFNGAAWVRAADMNRDGTPDVVAAAQIANTVAWYETLDGTGTNWLKHTVDAAFSGAISVAAGDLNGDGYADLVGAASSANQIALWRNVGGWGTNWSRLIIATNFGGARAVSIADVNGDGRLDILAAASSSNEIAWWQNMDGSATSWAKNVITNNFGGAYSIQAADLDNDGDPDVIAAGISDNQIAWWENVGGQGTNWLKHVVDANCLSARSVYPADLNEDGDTDLAGAAWGENSAQWWESLRQYYLDLAPANSYGLVDVATGWYDGGTWLTITAAPSNGCFFTGWTGDLPVADTNDNPLVIRMTTNRTIRAQFQRQALTITATTGANGGISPSGAVSVAYGASQSFTITPAPGYRISSVLLDGASNGIAGVQAFNGVTRDHTVHAEFEVGSFMLSVSSAHGTATPANETHTPMAGGSAVTCSLSGSPEIYGATQYVNTGWTGSGSIPVAGTNSSLSTNIFSDSTITWTWKTQYWFTASADVEGTVSATSAWHNAGASVSALAVPDTPHHLFLNWTGDLPTNQTTANPLSLTMSQARAVTAHFTTNQTVLTVTAARGTANPAAGSYTGAWGRVTNCLIDGGTITGGATQYVFTGWSGSGSVPTSGAATNVSVTVTNASRLTWQWRTEYQLQIAAGANGAVSTTNAWHPAGTNISVTAIPNPGYIFLGWSGDVPAANTNNNPLSLAMTQARSITASFVTNVPVLNVATAHGTANPVPGAYTGAWGRLVDCTITGSPEINGSTQYVGSGWSGSGSVPAAGSGTNVSVTVTNYSSLTWNWTTWYQLQASADTNGSVSPTNNWYVAGSNAVLAATPSNGWLFAQWVGDVPTANRYDNPLTLVMSQARTVGVSFATNAPRLTVASAHGTPVPPVGVQTGAAGRVIACTLDGSPEFSGATQYVCTGWTGAGGVPASGTDTNAGSVTISTNSAIIWNWATWHQLQASAGAFGTVSPTNGWYVSGSNVVVTATPDDAHHRFAYWSGDVPAANTNNNPLTLAMTRARTVSANFMTNETVISVVSAHGTANPTPGAYTGQWSRVVDASITGSPEMSGTTQYVVSGWSGAGSVPASGTGTNVSITVTTNSAITWNWATWYQLQPSAGSGGTISSTGGWYVAGSSVSITASPADVYRRFAGWSGDVPAANTNSNPVLLTMSQARTIAATFTTNEPILTIASAHGTANPAPGAYTGAWGRLVDCTIAGSPEVSGATQYVHSGWTGSGSVPASGAATNASITVTNNSTLTWTWTPWYQLQVFAGTNGSVSPTNNWYASGSNVTVTATPDPLFRFERWTGDVPAALTNTAQITLSMTQARTLTASFSTNRCRVTPAMQPVNGSRGSISPSTVQTSAPGGTITFTIAPSNHSHISYLVVDGLYSPPTNSYSFTNIIQDHTISAVFITDVFDIRVGSTSPSGQSVPASGLSSYEWNDTVTVRVVNSPIASGVARSFCSGWIDGSGDIPSIGSTTNAGTITVTTNSSILWVWSTNFWLNTQSDSGGTVDVSDGWYEPGTNLTITATPDPGASFTGWSGDTNGSVVTSNRITVLMDQTRTVRANFDRYPFVLVVTSPWGGASPTVGTYTNFYTAGFPCLITNSPILLGSLATQYLCIGWAGNGSITNGLGTNCLFTLNADSTIDWIWVTNFYYATALSGSGSVDVADGWYLQDTNLLITATPGPYHDFVEWSGQTNGCTPATNTLTVPLNQPRLVEATFTPTLTTLGTPWWWMAQYGFSGPPFDAAETNDADADLMLTWAEYVAGTDPTNRLSCLAMVHRWAGNNLAFSWQGATGRLYTVQSTHAITGTPVWTNRPNFTDQPGIAGTMNYTNTVSSPTPPEYLRITVKRE